MRWLFVICLIIAIIGIWGYIDFHLGKYVHAKNWKNREYPKRKSHIQLITNGGELYKSYFQDLQEAKHSIHILFYIVKNDRFSKLFFEALIEQAQRGIKIQLLLDWLGSRKVPKEWIMEARKYGIEIEFCHRPSFPFLFFTLQQRNHRKITIIDSHIGYLGGYNIGKEYIDMEPELSPWRDYHIRIEGEGALDLEQEFLVDWYRATNNKVNITHTPEKVVGESVHYFYPSEGIGVVEHIENLIHRAEESIIIGTPYFVPPKKVFLALLDALNRGVYVSVLVPDKADHPFVKEGSFPFLRKLLGAGGKVHQYEKGFFHAKVIVLDNTVCDIGTANFDNRSFLLNHEINCFIYDQDFIKEVKEALQEDMNRSTFLTLENLKKVPFSVTIREWIAGLVRGLL